jgi:hypothetical protein
VAAPGRGTGRLTGVIRRQAPASSSSRARPAFSIAVAGAALAGVVAVTGCSYMSPQQTTVAYQASDGVDASVGDVEISNLLIVSSAKGAPGVVTAQLDNHGSQDTTVSIADSDGKDSTTVKVPAGTAVLLSSGKGTQTVLSSVGVAPGSVTTLQLGSPAAGVHDVKVPVLLDDNYYSTITPTGGAGK